MSRASVWSIVGVVALTACGGESAPPPKTSKHPPADVACDPGTLLQGDGSCLEAGFQPGGCAAGEVPTDAGGCRPPGIPPDACAPGFVPADDGGCAPSLPAAKCPPGQLAVPGDAACHTVAPCGAPPWGDIPVDAATEYVDASYAGADGDGSAAKPWTTIQEGIDAASPGAIVAIAPGSYVEDVAVGGSAVRLWGLCPSAVEIVATGGELAALSILAAGAGVEVHGVAVRGPAWGIAISKVDSLLLSNVWVHGTAGRGIGIEDSLGATSVVVVDSLVEAAHGVGMFVGGAHVDVSRTLLRDTLLAGTSSRALEVRWNPNKKTRGSVALSESVLEDAAEIGISVAGADLTGDGVVVRGHAHGAIHLQSDGAERASIVLDGSVLEDNGGYGIRAVGSDGALTRTSIRRVTGAPETLDGHGVDGATSPVTGASKITLASSTISAWGSVAVVSQGSDFTLDACAIRDAAPLATGAEGVGRGIEIGDDPVSGTRGTLTLRQSVVERAADIAVLAYRADVLVEGSAARSTKPQIATGARGGGIALQSTAKGVIRSSLVEQTFELGIYVSRADASIDATLVRAVASDGASGAFGFGIEAFSTPDVQLPLTVRGSRVEDCRQAGVHVSGVTATLEDLLVQRIAADDHGEFGDGVVALASPALPASVTLTRGLVRDAARAALTTFGSHVTMSDTTLACSPIAIDAEELYFPPELDDGGGNHCGCDGAEVTCAALSSKLAAPPPLGE